MKSITLIALILGCLLLTAASLRKSSEKYRQKMKGMSSNGNIVSQLMNAASEVDRISLLDKDSDFVFDFVNPPTNKTTTTGEGGKIVVANRVAFPALVGTGIAMGLGFIGPCGFNTPHTHPRATEVFFAVNGTFSTGFIQENGARHINNTVYPGQAAVFPMGSIHWQANLGCESVEFVAALSNEDPGTSSIAQNFYGIDEGILSATLGGTDQSTLQSMLKALPKNVALGLQECQQKCGLSGGNSGNGSSMNNSGDGSMMNNGGNGSMMNNGGNAGNESYEGGY